jgi:mannose-6-phosphate isomerase-like protein (cupin superfamily)
MSGWRVTRVEDIEGVPWPGGITWHPVRMELGFRAFGIGGYTGDPGDVLIEPHDESSDGRGHQELYVVLAGSARFTLDGEELDVAAGGIVAVEPGVRREAVALEPASVVLAMGGPPTFEIAGSEWLMRARPLLESQPERARALLEEGLRQLPESPAIRYGFALLEGGGRWLEEAIAREPRLREEAVRDGLL